MIFFHKLSFVLAIKVHCKFTIIKTLKLKLHVLLLLVYKNILDIFVPIKSGMLALAGEVQIQV